MIKAIMFDWLGTLGDIKDRKSLTQYISKSQHEQLLVSPFEQVDIPKENKELVRSSLIEAKHFLYSDSDSIISALGKKYPLAVISNMYDLSVQGVRKSFPDFLSKFDVLAFSSEIGLAKPDPAIFNYVLGKLNDSCGVKIAPSEVLVIGDLPKVDYDPAKKLGMQAKIIDRNKQKLHDVLQELI
jgi:HAD superfamily hydrolase (TIGR01549 family)